MNTVETDDLDKLSHLLVGNTDNCHSSSLLGIQNWIELSKV